MAEAEPKLLLPFLQPFYEAMLPLSWPIIRVAVGWNLFVHGYSKILPGRGCPGRKGFADHGFVPPALFWWRSSSSIEIVGGICITLGLFTRFFAAAASPSKCGSSVCLITGATASRWIKRGYEYVLLWGLVELRHRAARRRALFARSQDRPGAVDSAAACRPCLSPRAAATYCAATLRLLPSRRGG